MRLLGVDLGEKRIGLALSDELGFTAQGLDVLPHRDDERSLAELVRLVRLHQVGTIVLGLPRNMDGSSGPMVKKVEAFGTGLRERLPDVTVTFWDERLTTSAAQKVLIETDMSRARRKQVVDKVAAMMILQGYMDGLRIRQDREKHS